MNLSTFLQLALEEDAPMGDVTTQTFLPDPQVGHADICVKGEGVFFGEAVIKEMTSLVGLTVQGCIRDGDSVKPGDRIVTLKGDVQAILLGERVMLNVLQRLSGIATLTNQFVRALSDPNIAILDTRKTTPLLRDLEKAAVVSGGGVNHRRSLSDMILIKENHLGFMAQISRLDTLEKTIQQTKILRPDLKIEIEVSDLDQLKTLPLKQVDYILLDNFQRSDIEAASKICKERALSAELEVSGNVSLASISEYRGLPIQRISIGAVTHSVKVLDLSLLFLA